MKSKWVHLFAAAFRKKIHYGWRIPQNVTLKSLMGTKWKAEDTHHSQWTVLHVHADMCSTLLVLEIWFIKTLLIYGLLLIYGWLLWLIKTNFYIFGHHS